MGLTPISYDTLRVLIGYECNLGCGYCCNEQPRFRNGIRPTRLADLDLSPYKVVCVSGGEPLLHLHRVRQVARLRANRSQLFVLYTNGTLLTRGVAQSLAAMRVDAINVGLHQPSQFGYIISNVEVACKDLPIKLRYHAQERLEGQCLKMWPHLSWRFWRMNDCNRANERRVVLTDWAPQGGVNANFVGPRLYSLAQTK